MTKLDELRKIFDEARDAYYAEDDKLVDAETAYDVAFDAYRKALKEINEYGL